MLDKQRIETQQNHQLQSSNEWHNYSSAHTFHHCAMQRKSKNRNSHEYNYFTVLITKNAFGVFSPQTAQWVFETRPCEVWLAFEEHLSWQDETPAPQLSCRNDRCTPDNIIKTAVKHKLGIRQIICSKYYNRRQSRTRILFHFANFLRKQIKMGNISNNSTENKL